MDDDAVRALLATAEPLGVGIGGETAVTKIAGHRVFIKKIPLCALERLPENVGSTANLFALPMFYQYGIGSAGFGAWRELAVHDLTTSWVLDGRHSAFPLTYHHRVLPDLPGPDLDPQERRKGIEEIVKHWDASPAVRRRVEAIDETSARIVVFLEYVPMTLAEWLHSLADADCSTQTNALGRAVAALEDGVEFMASHGLVHFDAHPANILTDGTDFYFADFGLALSATFDLSPAESAFLDEHADFDWVEVLGELHNAVHGVGVICPAAKEVVLPYAEAPRTIRTFINALVDGPKTLPYPRAAFASVRDGCRVLGA